MNDDRKFEENNQKSELEGALEKAIEDGNFVEAEQLNEQLVKQQAEQKIVKAIEKKQYFIQLEQKEQKQQSKKRKIAWRFDTKQRWET
eukprot:CAMPEP_0168561064 /NCGR_PEP_ID=MMETSP0413-20121227/11391_1 /TAXON_ID=136452 /ORGANISM="Filamoeba nolandi, Strain NC-AS-23-1" /LENGTH=87 /DNA_ID=CAMNT_0008592401 /DNA_START=173 /DNA_END=432 /DNA_ORIENTATION=+